MTGQDSLPNRILLGHLISNGDCLYATAIARQIKHDFPGSHLTWAVSSFCRKIIEENPFVDEIWEIPFTTWSYELLPASWAFFEGEALKRYEEGVYDFIFFTQIYPGNPHHFEGTVRPGIFLGYPGKITVPLQPSLFLRAEELERVNIFVQQNRLHEFEQVILFECSAKSGQTHVTPEFALQTAETIAKKWPGKHAVILSSQHAVQTSSEGIIDGSALTLREMAELTKHCSLLIGCSSGISCVSTSTWAKPLPMIQMLANRCAMFASLAHDYLYFGLPTSHVIEMFDADVERLVSCFETFLQHGWTKTRDLYHEDPQITFSYYLDFAKMCLLDVYDYYGFCVSLQHTVDRYGWHPDLEAALKLVARKILPPLAVDQECSPDELLRQLRRPARLLSSVSIGILGYNAPSIRPETCVLSLRRNKQELEQILEAAGGFSRDDPEFSQLVAALIDTAPKERIAILQAKNPERKWPPIVWILALMQQAEYSEARRELIQCKQMSRSWSSHLEEILADLNWMQGYHTKALAGYQAALSDRSNHPKLQKKIDRLLIRNHRTLATTKPEAQLTDLGLVFYIAGPINNFFVKALTSVRLKITSMFNLETAFLIVPENGSKAWALIDGEDLPKTGPDLFLQRSKRSPNCKEFVDAATDWASRKGKKWVALARLDSVITPTFLRELQNQLVQHPNALVVERWEIPEKHLFTPGLILMGIDWWRENRWRFRGYQLHGIDWLAFYASKILRLTKADYLCGPEQRLLTIEAQAPPAGGKERLGQLAPVLKGDLSAVIRSKLFELSRDRASKDLNSDRSGTMILVQHFFCNSILKAVFTRPPAQK